MTVLYRGVVTTGFRTKNLMNFVDGIGDSSELNTYYFTFGRKEPWSTYETSAHFKPPYPATDDTGIAQTWDNYLGFIKINKSSWAPVIPRIDWGSQTLGVSGTVFKEGQVVVVNSLQGINEYDTADSGYMIYRCVETPNVGVCNISSISDKEACIKAGGEWTPVGTPAKYENIPKGKKSAIDTLDGYLWDYLYTIPADEVINSTNEDYIVVPTPAQIDSDPARWGLANVNRANQINRIIYEVSCNSIMGTIRLADTDFPEMGRDGLGYRQITIVSNPLESKVLPGDPDVKCVKYSYRPNEVLTESGEILYVENRPPIYRSPDQTESVRIILSF